MPTLRSSLPWLALFCFAFALRAIYLQDLERYPDFDMPAVDAAYHDYWAQGIATGTWGMPSGQVHSESPLIESHPYFRPPGYPLFLGAVYTVVGHRYVAARLAQFALGSLSCLLLVTIGARIFGPAVGWIAGSAMATYWVLIYYDGEFQPPALVVPLALLAIIAALQSLKSGGWRWPALTGALLGLAALTVPNFLVHVVAFALFIGVARRGKEGVKGAILVIAAALVTIAPATIRNRVIGGEWVLISTNGGINLYAGNSPSANGWDLDIPDFGTSFDHRAVVRRVEAETGHSMTDSEVSREFERRALAYIGENPGRTTALIGTRALLFFGGVEVFSNKELNTARAESKLLRRLPLDFPIVLGAALAGLMLLTSPARSSAGVSPLMDRTGAALLFVFVAALVLSYLPFFVVARYRLPIVPPLLLFGAAGVVEAARHLRARSFMPVVGAFAFAAIVQQVDRVDLFGATPSAAYFHQLMGVSHARKGEDAAALARFERALSIKPDFAPALHERANVLLRLGRADDAVADLRAALRVQPDDKEAQIDLGRALAHANGAAIEDSETLLRNSSTPEVANNMGLALANANRLDDAVSAYDKALRLDPSFLPALVNRAIALGRQGRYSESEAGFLAALRIEPGNPAAQANLNYVRSLIGTPGATK